MKRGCSHYISHFSEKNKNDGRYTDHLVTTGKGGVPLCRKLWLKSWLKS